MKIQFRAWELLYLTKENICYFTYAVSQKSIKGQIEAVHEDLVYTVNQWWTTDTLFPKYPFRTVEIELHTWHVGYHHIVGLIFFL